MFSDESDVPPECMVVVDVGYSYSHVVPIRGGEIVWEHVKR
jgi:actin-related protein 6